MIGINALSISRRASVLQLQMPALVLLLLSTTAWLALVAIALTPAAAPLRAALQHQPAAPFPTRPAPSPSLSQIGWFESGWVVMLMAMMLPALVSAVGASGALGVRPGRTERLTAFVLAYLFIWATFGLALFLLDRQLHAAALRSHWLAGHTPLLVPGAMLLAGAYQLSPLKRRCLAACRSARRCSPTPRWGGLTSALVTGAHYGLCCLGACWALMFVVFATGMSQLVWMLGVTSLILLERLAAPGRWLAIVFGGGITAWGLYSAVTFLVGQ